MDEGTMLEWIEADSDSWTAKNLAIGMLSQVMGQSPYEVYDWDDWFSAGRVREYCERKGIHWGKLIESDARRCCAGQLPEFFLGHLLWADIYRRNHSVAYAKPESNFVHGDQTLRHISEYMVDTKERVLETPRRMGWACPMEQAYFYQTEEWKRCASAYRYLDGYECKMCRQRNEVLHVHHRMPILTAYHHNFHLCFSWWKLEALCESCHKKIHNRTIRSIFDYSYVHVGPAEVKEEKAWLKKIYAKHHADGACQWCNERSNDEVNFGW